MIKGAVWILGATGRTGRAVAARVIADGILPVLVGRDAARLNDVADQLSVNVTIELAESLSAIIQLIAEQRPAVVLNTIGPFTTTAAPIAYACPPGTHYIDISNELPSVQAILALHEHAIARGSTYVTGAGFGVLGTESIVLKLCQDRPAAKRVRCAAIPDVVAEPGRLGEAFAASITEGLAFGGRRYRAGQLVRAPALGDFERVPLPDGRLVGTASVPSGELEAAQRASLAPLAVSATSMVPAAAILRAIIPPVLAIMKIAPVRRFAARRIAGIEVKPAPRQAPPVSWAHARIEWPSGEARQGWLRTGDAMVFTADVMARIAIRLAKGEGRPGAFTPGALFGFELAQACGGEIIIETNSI